MAKTRIKNIVAKRADKKASKTTRFVLMVGDEGAILLHIHNGKVKNRQFSSDAQAPETQAFLDTVKASPRVPLMVVFDTIDQAYVQQTLPPVTSMSINKLIKRRLERDFSDDYLKAALPLGKEKEGRKDWLFMMVALQRTGVVKSWLDVVSEWPNHLVGIHMLPVEAIRIINRLNEQAGDGEKPGVQWQFLVSYNRVSGIRQVVCKNGVLTLTRLGQPALESNPEAIAGTIEQEIIGTKEYLKRLGYDEKDRLTINVIVAEDIRRHIDIKKLRADKAELYTPHEAAEYLGLKEATQPSDRYGDVVLSAAIGTSAKPVLKLITPEISQLVYLYAGLMGGRVAAFAMVLALIAACGISAVNIFQMSREARDFSAQHEKKKAEMLTLKEKAKKMTDEDMDQVVDTVAIYEKLLEQAYNPESLLMVIEDSLGQDVRAYDLSWILDEKSAASGAASKSRATVNMTLEFPVELAEDRDRLLQLTTDTLNRLKIALPGYDITYLSVPSIISDREQIDVNIVGKGTAPTKPATELSKAVQARLQVVGPVNPPTPVMPPSNTPANTGSAPADAPKASAEGGANGAR